MDWVLGHASGRGNETAHGYASAQSSIRSDPDISVPPVLIAPNAWEKKAASKMADHLHLREQTPAYASPLPKGLPRGAQVLIHKARTGAALTEDVLVRWRVYTPKKGRPPDADELGSTPVPHTVPSAKQRS